MKEVESVLAEKRLSTLGATGGRGNKKGTPDSAEGLSSSTKGESRNIVAKKVGLKSRHEVDRSIKAINTIDSLYLYP